MDQALLVLFIGESIISWVLEWINEITNEIKSSKNIKKILCLFLSFEINNILFNKKRLALNDYSLGPGKKVNVSPVAL